MTGVAEILSSYLQHQWLFVIVSLAAAAFFFLFMRSRTQARRARRRVAELENSLIEETLRLRNLRDLSDRLSARLQSAEDTISALKAENIEIRRSELQRTTELYQAKKEVSVLSKDLKELSRQVQHAQRLESLGALTGGIAHDFNNTLGVIVAHAALLRTADMPALANSRIETILRSAERGAALVRQLLSFARNKESDKGLVYANDLVVELRELLDATLPASIELDTLLDDDLPPVTGDKSQLYQALLNLCINARDAMPGGGKLGIATFVIGGERLRPSYPDASLNSYVGIAVSDSGTGIEDAVRDRIFEPFFSTKEMGKGTGLGLSVTQSTVKNNDGFIHLETRMGAGSVFTMYIPASGGLGARPLLESHNHSIVQGGQEVIAVFEDKADLLDALVMHLRSAGYSVFGADSGHEAFELLSTLQRIDLIVSDIQLPGMDGIQLCAHARSAFPGIGVILCSGYVDDPLRQRLREHEFDDIIVKPFAFEQLHTRIRSLLDVREDNTRQVPDYPSEPRDVKPRNTQNSRLGAVSIGGS